MVKLGRGFREKKLCGSLLVEGEIMKEERKREKRRGRE